MNAPVVLRTSLEAGQKVAGPVVVTEDETTVVTPSSREVFACADGTLDVRVRTVASPDAAAIEQEEPAHV